MCFGHKERQTGQWPRTQSPETNLHIYGQLVFNEDADTIRWGKEEPFRHMALGQLDIHRQNNKFKALSHIIHKH